MNSLDGGEMCSPEGHPVDWTRSLLTDNDREVADYAIAASLEFLRSMESVRPQYEAQADIERYRAIATPIILAAVDAYHKGDQAIMRDCEATGEWLAQCGADWGDATTALLATMEGGLLELKTKGGLDGGEFWFWLSERGAQFLSNLPSEEQQHEKPPDDTQHAVISPLLGGIFEEPEDTGQASDESGHDLDHSRPLDVHTWSDHPEANAFVDQIYEEHFAGGNPNIRKRHLKVVLLDLYVAWTEDPTLKIAYSRNVNDYDAGTRYNALHISRTTIPIVDRLVEAGFLEQALGFFDRERGVGRLSRIWPTEVLIEKFKEAKFGPQDIGGDELRECIVLRDEAGNDLEYEDTPETERMRDVLRDYNDLLRTTFIDIPVLEKPFIELEPDPRDRMHTLQISQRDKFVRRIFNRGAFDKGGRFWGGWWQRCPKEWREAIFINDQPTSEIDYSGLHIVMLYAQRGIDYWSDVGYDPYTIERPDFLGSDEQARLIAKQLLLTALNARDDRSAFGAFRDQAATGSEEKRLTNDQLGEILRLLRETHEPIADRLASDAGIDLMYLDSMITERLIEDFTHDGIPILTIHDSFIVPYGLEEALETHMQKAFEQVMGVAHVRVKNEAFKPESWEPLDYEDTLGFDHADWERDMEHRYDPPRSERYLYQLELFNSKRGT
jgi:hypothetical protein